MNQDTDETAECKGSRPATVAVTGGIGSGKSLVCRHLEQKGLFVISADELSRLAVMPGTDAHAKIAEYFGDRVLMPDNTIDRPTLRSIISADPEAKKALESFVHPEVFVQMAQQMEVAAERGECRVIVEVPLLFESGLEKWFDYVVLVSVDRETRIRRIMLRDSVSREAAEAMIRIQMPEHEKRERSDFIIDNNDTEEKTLQSVDRLYEFIISNIGSNIGSNIRKKDDNG